MRIFGFTFFEDPEEDGFKKEWKEKRRARIIEQCDNYTLKDKGVFWDMIELPGPVDRLNHDEATKEEFASHERLMKKQECHVFYGKKYCYHLGEEQITDIDNNGIVLPKPNQGEIVEKP